MSIPNSPIPIVVPGPRPNEEATETKPESSRQQEIREALFRLAYTLSESDGRRLFYSISALLAEQSGKSKAEFLGEQQVMTEAVKRAQAAGLSVWGVMIAGLAAVASDSNATQAGFLDMVVEIQNDLDAGVRQGMRETVRAHLWPWPAPEVSPQKNENLSKD